MDRESESQRALGMCHGRLQAVSFGTWGLREQRFKGNSVMRGLCALAENSCLERGCVPRAPVLPAWMSTAARRCLACSRRRCRLQPPWMQRAHCSSTWARPRSRSSSCEKRQTLRSSVSPPALRRAPPLSCGQHTAGLCALCSSSGTAYRGVSHEHLGPATVHWGWRGLSQAAGCGRCPS